MLLGHVCRVVNSGGLISDAADLDGDGGLEDEPVEIMFLKLFRPLMRHSVVCRMSS